jgi:hypothetical protein
MRKFLLNLSDFYDSELAFKTYFESTECQLAFKWKACKCYREFANFIGEFPRFQSASFDLTEWRNVNVKLRTWLRDAGFYLPITSLGIFGHDQP